MVNETLSLSSILAKEIILFINKLRKQIRLPHVDRIILKKFLKFRPLLHKIENG